MSTMSPDLLEKILKLASELTTAEGFLLAGAASPIIGPVIGGAWVHGRSSGRQYEVLHGQVPQLQGKLTDARHEILALGQKVDNRETEIRILRQNAEILTRQSRTFKQLDTTTTVSQVLPHQHREAAAPLVPPTAPTPLDSQSLGLPQEVLEILRVRNLLIKDDADVWQMREPRPLAELRERLLNSGLYIITVGNLKGGVGKTTVTGNLAAYFAKKVNSLNKRVLVIDLDYQGSLTATLLQAAGKTIDKSVAEHLLSGNASGKQLGDMVKSIEDALPGVDLIPSGYTLAGAEDLLMMRWIFHTIEKDVRFNLADFLLSKQVRDTYKIILIDIGPRLTTASISALCASTHLLVPTNLDRLSAETIGSFLNRVKSLKENLNLPIQLAGVLGTMTYRDRLTNAERDTLGTIKDGLRQWGPDGYVFQRSIPRKNPLANLAGSDIGYRRDDDVRALFNTLGDELCGRIGYEGRAS